MPPARTSYMSQINNAVLIAGPTASGKSALALDIAVETGGVIINADAMQVYSVLRVLTARPDDGAFRLAPHQLYGHVHPSTAYSVASWLADVGALVRNGALGSRPPIFVGGTGLYFTALTEGLSDIPPIPPDVRNSWRRRHEQEGAEGLHALLAERDPAVAERLTPTDGQRIVRALEVLDATGRSLAHWQAQRSAPLLDTAGAEKIILEPDRDVLAARIDARFDRMLAEGAQREVSELMALNLAASLPAMKAIGVPELSGVQLGHMGLEEAARQAKAATRQYAKRQMTWFRNQFGPDWIRRPS